MLAAVGGAASGAEAQEAPFRSTRIDHISIQVTELPRSIDFYEKVFGLSILDAGVQDFAGNTTRFLIIGRQPAAEGANKTTIVFTVPNEAGALFKALSVFALRDIDMTKLESRPIPDRPFEYLFYVDLSATRENLPCQRALMHLAEFAPLLRTLGSYPRWQEPDAN